MGTPNSPLGNIFGSPVDYILGETPRVQWNSLGVDQQVAVLEAVLGRCKPHLKYLPGFEPIQKELHGSQGPHVPPRESARAAATFSDGLSEVTLCVEIDGLSHETKGELAPGQGVRFIHEKCALLTRAGDIVLWEAEWERQLRTDQRDRLYVVHVGQMHRFTLLDIPDLCREYPDAAKQLIVLLFSELERGIRARENRLSSMRMDSQFVNGVFQRIG